MHHINLTQTNASYALISSLYSDFKLQQLDLIGVHYDLRVTNLEKSYSYLENIKTQFRLALMTFINSRNKTKSEVQDFSQTLITIGASLVNAVTSLQSTALLFECIVPKMDIVFTSLLSLLTERQDVWYDISVSFEENQRFVCLNCFYIKRQ